MQHVQYVCDSSTYSITFLYITILSMLSDVYNFNVLAGGVTQLDTLAEIAGYGPCSESSACHCHNN